MRRFWVILLGVITLSATTVSAQSYLTERKVGAVEVELGVGLATAANRISHFGESRQGVEVSAEVRYNFSQTPLDIGVHFGLCSFTRTQQLGNYSSKHDFDSQMLMVVSDYNFFQGRLASLFIGAGAGVAWNNLNANATKSGFNACVMPRIGVELSNHVRITAAYKFYEKANNHLVLSVGFAFGGGTR